MEKHIVQAAEKAMTAYQAGGLPLPDKIKIGGARLCRAVTRFLGTNMAI
jgi:hypothetical protein